jgi:hypothetical protein
VLRPVRSLRDWFLLRRAEAIVRGRAPERQAAIRGLCDAAMSRAALADESNDPRFASSAIAIYAESIRLLVNALLIAKDVVPPGPPLELDEALAQLEALSTAPARVRLPRRYAATRAILYAPDRLVFDVQDASETVRGRSDVEALLAWLLRKVGPWNMRQIWTARGLRFAVLAGTLALAISWTAGAVDEARNLALHKPVTLSARFPGTPDPSGATDGEIVPPFQAHTTISADPWLTIDLQKVRDIGRVEIYNRADMLQGDALPLALELSNNGVDYHVVDRRTTIFTEEEPWVFRSRTAAGRYVRVHGHPGGYVVVTEIKVYPR